MRHHSTVVTGLPVETKEPVRSVELGKDVTLSLAVGELVGLSREDCMWLGRGGDGLKWGSVARCDIW